MLNSHKCTTSIVQFVKAAIIVISVHLKISTLPVVSHVLTTKVSSEWRLNLGLWTQKTCPFPLNRVVYSIEVADLYKDSVDVLEQFRFLGNCPPTPPLSHHFSLSER